jgi:putative transposase
MARPLRIQRAGSWYHITARGNERRDIFRDDKDRRHLLELLKETVGMFGWRLHAFVLMSNHYHLLVELAEPNLSRSMQWLNASYSIWFNWRHQRSGHLLQGRFKSVLVEPESWGLELSRYIHLNPVRLGRLGLGKTQVQRSRAGAVEQVSTEELAKRISVLRRYPWSSFRAYIGSAHAPSWLTTVEVLKLAGKTNRPGEAYRKYCEEAIKQGGRESPWHYVAGQAVLGSERFIAGVVKGLKKSERRRLNQRPKLERVIALVEQDQGEKWKEFRDRYGDMGRDLVLHLGRTACGLSYRELSQQVEIAYSSAAGAVRRFSQRLTKDVKTAERMRQLLAKMNNA